MVARLASESDFTRIVRSDDISQTNQLGAFTKFATTVVPTGESEAYSDWVSNQSLSQTACHDRRDTMKYIVPSGNSAASLRYGVPWSNRSRKTR